MSGDTGERGVAEECGDPRKPWVGVGDSGPEGLSPPLPAVIWRDGMCDGDVTTLRAEAKSEVAKTERKVPKRAEAKAKTNDRPVFRTLIARWQAGSCKIWAAVGRFSGFGERRLWISSLSRGESSPIGKEEKSP